MRDRESKYINPINFKDWDDHVLALKNTSIFYSSFWANVLQQSYGYVPMYLTQFSNNELKTLLPLMFIKSWLTGCRAVSLPFTDYCDPYVSDENNFKNIFKELISIGQNSNWKSVEFKGGSELFHDEQSSLNFYHHLLQLSDEKSLFSKFKSSTKRNIKKAEREGVQILIDNSSDSMENFYKLNCLTRKKHGLPSQPKQFFKNFYEFIIKDNHGIIATAVKNNTIIAAAIFLHFKNKVVYKYGASDTHYLHLRANNLVMWESIKYYTQKGFKIFDFGKTEINNEGLRRYKLSWGTDETMIKYFLYNFASGNFIKSENKESGWYNWFFRKMPIPLLKASGTLLYKHVG